MKLTGCLLPLPSPRSTQGQNTSVDATTHTTTMACKARILAPPQNFWDLSLIGLDSGRLHHQQMCRSLMLDCIIGKRADF